MLSDNTTKRIRAIKARVDEFMRAFDVPEAQAWLMVTSNEACKAAETAERLERKQKQIALAEMRAKSAEAATFKANIAEEEGK